MYLDLADGDVSIEDMRGEAAKIDRELAEESATATDIRSDAAEFVQPQVLPRVRPERCSRLYGSIALFMMITLIQSRNQVFAATKINVKFLHFVPALL